MRQVIAIPQMSVQIVYLKENQTSARALVYHPLTRVYSQACTFRGNRGQSMQTSEKQGWELLFRTGLFPPPLPPTPSVGYSVIMRAVTLGMFLFLPFQILSMLSFPRISNWVRDAHLYHITPTVLVLRTQVIPLLLEDCCSRSYGCFWTFMRKSSGSCTSCEHKDTPEFFVFFSFFGLMKICCILQK